MCLAKQTLLMQSLRYPFGQAPKLNIADLIDMDPLANVGLLLLVVEMFLCLQCDMADDLFCYDSFFS